MRRKKRLTRSEVKGLGRESEEEGGCEPGAAPRVM